ncbi:MAG: Gfo/Idh/MocA family oxidoreductase, partial [Gammaproteobacteria bacterium]|nr:Gfo/Idh/MocA family oxidoreductase [Gammaproteobacteria bacterium]
ATTSVKFAMGFNRREHPLHRQARRLIADAAIGKVRSVMSSFCEPAAALPTWKQRRATGGGVLLDLASHHIDMLRWTLSTEVSAVEARISSRVSEDDEAWLGLSLTSGVEVMSFFSFRSACTDWIEFIGENGTLRVDRHRAALSIRTARRSGYGTRLTWQPPSAEVLRWWMDRMRHPSRDPSYRFALLSHIRQLQGATTELADVEDGLRNLETVLAAEACGRSRGRVSMRRNV